MLKDIKETICPICGAEVVEESKRNQHVNGHWNESRKFSCGLMLNFSPNFMETAHSDVYKCAYDPELVIEKARAMVALDKLRNYIKRLDLGEEVKEGLIKKSENYLLKGF